MMKEIKLKSNYLLDLNKKELNDAGREQVEIELDLGQQDATELLIVAKKAQEYLNGFVSALLSPVSDELYLNDNNEKKIHNSLISLGSTGDRLDYEKDLEYLRRKKHLKDREELLKLAFKSDDEIIDSDGGIVEKVPIKSPSREIVKVKL